MITGSYQVKKGDYINGGQVSSRIKEVLSKLGITSDIIRRIMIAVYEAEMNIIIHSHGGEICFTIDDEKIEITVKDTGPGIPRIDLAIQEGYSTAPDEAREMGFGAGMGLPNIRKNSDHFFIQSESSGTLLKIIVFIKSGKDFSKIDSYVSIEAEKCKQCLRCITRCPTKAIRLYKKDLYILSHHCINCNECIRTCPTKVFDLKYDEKQMQQSVLIVPSPWITSILQFSPWDEFKEEFKQKENLTIYPLASWEDAIRRETLKYIENNRKVKYPSILPFCPAVIYWIQTEYPALIENISPYLGPIETAINSFPEQNKISFIPSCPAQICAIENNKDSETSISIISPQKSLEMVMNMNKDKDKKRQAIDINNVYKQDNNKEYIISVSGIEYVRAFLANMEKERLTIPMKIVELYACYNGCFGSPYWIEEPTVSKMIFNSFWNRQKEKVDSNKFEPIFRVSSIKSRKGIRLDEDVKNAITKLSEIEKINKILPGYDCGVCGAPTCLNLAEDIVVRQYDKNNCPYINKL